MIEAWLRRFYPGKQKQLKGITLTFNDKTIQRTDCISLGNGSEKSVFKIKGTNQCILIPHKYRDERSWNQNITVEKRLLDSISALGLKTQQFEIVPMTIQKKGEQDTLKVLVTKDFESLCQEEAIVIYNHKDSKKFIGTPPDFMAMREQFKNIDFARQVLDQIVNEYAIACTFSLPISVLGPLDDSQHLYFTLPKDPDAPPVVGYMFWDVVGDWGGCSLPVVPTLQELRSGLSKNSSEYNAPIRGLKDLANLIACAIHEMTPTPPNSEKQEGWEILSDFRMEIQNNLLEALDNNQFLNKALVHAREKAATSLAAHLDSKYFKDNISRINDNRVYSSLIHSAISIGRLDLVERVRNLRKDLTTIPNENIEEIMGIAKKYDNKPILAYLKTNLVLEKVKQDTAKAQQQTENFKNTFIKAYDKQLRADKSSWCGLYSFFATSNIGNKSLAQLVLHAQGFSEQGSGMRSRTVMRALGWLDNNNKMINTEISALITPALTPH